MLMEVILPKLSDKARERAQQLLLQAAEADRMFKIYIQACSDSLDLEGDWNLDTNTWSFDKMPEEKKQ